MLSIVLDYHDSYLRWIKYCVINVGRKGKVRYDAMIENPNPVFMASCEKK